MLFDKNGYLKLGLSEEVVKEIVRKYTEQEETKRIFENYLKNESRSMEDIARALTDCVLPKINLNAVRKSRLSNLDIARKCFVVEPLPTGALPIYDRDPEVGMMVASEVFHSKEIPSSCIYCECGGDKLIRCSDAECFTCVTDSYCNQAIQCTYCAVSIPAEEEQIANLLSMVDLGEEDKACSTPAPTQKQHHANGMTCRRCNVLNKYITESNQTDGTYLCWGCKAGF